MEMWNYISLALLWILTCLLLGLYITGKGFSGRKQFRFGLKAMLVSYLFGLCMLFIVIVFHN